MSLISFVEGDDEGEVQVCLDAIGSHRIVRFVEGGYLDGIVHAMDGFVERHQAGYGVMSSGIGKGEEEGELGGVVQRVGRQFVEGMSIDETIPIGVISPVGCGIFEPSSTGAFLLTVAAFMSVGIGPGGDLGAISGHAEVVPVDQAKLYRAIYGQGLEEGVDASFQVGETQMVGVVLDMVGQLPDIGSVMVVDPMLPPMPEPPLCSLGKFPALPHPCSSIFHFTACQGVDGCPAEKCYGGGEHATADYTDSR